MHRRWLPALLLLSPLLSTACATFYLVRPGDLPPSTADISPDRSSLVWKRAVGVLLDQGYVPQVLNEAACFISAKRREDIADDALAGTIVLFSISPEGKVTVQLSGGGLFHTEEQFLAAVGQRQNAIFNLILNPQPARPAAQ